MMLRKSPKRKVKPAPKSGTLTKASIGKAVRSVKSKSLEDPQHKMPLTDWIKVSDEVPPENTWVLGWLQHQNSAVIIKLEVTDSGRTNWYADGEMWLDDMPITHWCKIEEPVR